MKKSCLCLAALFLPFLNTADAQTTIFTDFQTLNKNIISPSPNASALGKFGDIPVGPNTGLPKITVPVYQWSSAGSNLSLNISLDYHAGGVKVDDMASDVGLGWALSAGGVISRTMRGLPDELPNGFLQTATLTDINTGGYSEEFLNPLVGYASTVMITPTNASSAWALLESINTNAHDGQQDIFSLSCGGLSAKFFIGKDGSIVQAEKSNLEIIPVAATVGTYTNPISYFKVITTDGTTYVFDQIESTSSITRTYDQSANESDNTQNPYTSSWYLSKIQSANGTDEIDLTYQNTGLIYGGGVGEYVSYSLDPDPVAGTGADVLRTRTRSYPTITVSGLRLYTISLPDGTGITFDYSTSTRLDAGDNALQKITITNGSQVKGVRLYQDYFTTSLYTGETATTADQNRLRLYKVQGFGNNTTTQNPYLFYYNTTALPNRLSFYQDYWGFPIGPSRNALSMIPETFNIIDGDQSSSTYDPYNMISEGTYKEPDSNYNQAAILQRIVYPTKGSTSLVYESNTAAATTSPYFRKPKQVSVDVYDSQVNTDITYDLSAVPPQKLRFTMQITETAPRPTICPGCPTPIIDGALEATSITVTLSNAAGTWSNTLFSGTYGQLLVTPAQYKFVDIPASGVYKVNVTFTAPYPQPFYATIAGSYSNTDDRIVGGLRVKSTVDSALTATGGVIVKNYNYNTIAGHSSGVIGAIPNYDYYPSTQVYSPDGGFTIVGPIRILNRSSDPTMALASIQGAPVDYLNVEVKSTDASTGGSLGKTAYTYTPIDFAGLTGIYPYTPGQYMDWNSGLPLGEFYYDSSNTLKKSIENTWSLNRSEVNDANYRSLKVGIPAITTDVGTGAHDFVCKAFYPFTGIAQKLTTIEKNYEGSSVVTTTTTNQYDATYHTLKVSTKNNEKGQFLESRLFYPQDFTGITVYGQMVTDNMVGTPVKKEEWLLDGSNSYLVSGSVAEYKVYGTTVIKPYKQYDFNSFTPLSSTVTGAFDGTVLYPTTEPYNLKFTFDAYDSHGNPTQATPANSISGSYLWGYNNTYPIANCTNAAPNEFYYAGFEDDGTATVGAAHTGNKYTTDQGINWPIPNSRGYVISYWYLSGGTWHYSGELPFLFHLYLMQTADGYDDIRIYPKDSQMTTYTYTPMAGVTSVTDAKNTTTYYEYDDLHRLINIRDQDGKIVKSFFYHYAQ